jgi:hypothetical protein
MTISGISVKGQDNNRNDIFDDMSVKILAPEPQFTLFSIN